MNLNKSKDLQKFGVALLVLVALNFLASNLFFRVDLTEDKRFSLAEPTRKLIRGLKNEVLIEVYLRGDFPARFEKIEKAIEDKLKEMKMVSEVGFTYRFIDPNSIKDDSLKKQTFQNLMALGIDPLSITDYGTAQTSERFIFPGAVIVYNGKQIGVNLVKGNVSMDINDDLRIAQSISMIEYELANGLKIVSEGRSNRIAFLRGHGESTGRQLVSIGTELSKFGKISFLELAGVNSIDSLNKNFDLIVCIKPVKPYTEADKYKLDQFLMNGGNLGFYIDAVDLRIDSTNNEKFIGVARELNLTDMLFTYGARINQTIIQDMQGMQVPSQTSKGNYVPVNNYLMPIINTFSKHESVKYGKPVLFQDCATVDTIRAEGIKKTPLMFTGRYTRVNGSPIFFPVKELMEMNQHDQTYFNRNNLPVTYLLEGKFSSSFAFKSVPEGFDRNNKRIKANKSAKIIVCSDGDFITNGVDFKTGQPTPLGVNPYNKQEIFSNVEVASTLFDYQLGDAEINSLRVKDVEKRPLDKLKLMDDKIYYQILNIGLPIILVLIFGLSVYFFRKWRYTRF